MDFRRQICKKLKNHSVVKVFQVLLTTGKYSDSQFMTHKVIFSIVDSEPEIGCPLKNKIKMQLW